MIGTGSQVLGRQPQAASRKPALVGALIAALLAPAAAVAADAPAKVAFVEGSAERERAGEKVALQLGAALAEQDTISTADDSRLEIKFADESLLRVGPGAKLQLSAAHFGKRPEERKMTARLLFGKLWAKVTSVLKGDNNFQVETENAVAGVRGTTFRVDANADKSVRVRVYNGSVAVAKNAPIYQKDGVKPGERKEVDGPEEVSREAWEELVGRQMEITVSADGTPGKPTKFDPKTEGDDDWVQWNRKRDAAKR